VLDESQFLTDLTTRTLVIIIYCVIVLVCKFCLFRVLFLGNRFEEK